MTLPKNTAKAIFSFFIVLLLMPLGHATMILMEHFLAPGALHASAFAMGAVGLAVAVVGVFVKGDTRQTVCGLAGGLLFWTGWVEFLFMYYANRYGTLPQLDPATGEVVTKPEYLILPATFGLWTMVMTLYIFCTSNGCLLINWLQRRLFGSSKQRIAARPMTRHTSMVTFMELNMILWTSYLLLMFCYDPQFLGDDHPVTLAIGAGCFVGALFIFKRQLRISTWGGNLRMAIATVVTLWTPVEILGRNDFFHEIWIAPLEHPQAMTAIFAAFILSLLLPFISLRRRRV